MQYKKFGISSLFAFFVSSSAHAEFATSFSETATGLPTLYKHAYWTLQFGVGVQNNASVKGILQTNSNAGFAWRSDVGYVFPHVFGLELGYTHYPTLSPKTKAGTLRYRSQVQTMDLLGTLNFNYNRYYLTFKAGANALWNEYQQAVLPLGTEEGEAVGPVVFSVSRQFIEPELGADLGFMISARWFGRVSYSHTWGEASITQPSNFIPILNWFGAGLSFLF